MLLVIATKNKMKFVNRDVENAFPHAETMEKVHATFGPEFGFKEGCEVEIIKNMHVQATASRAWSLHFDDFILTLGFTPKKADQDTWIKEEDDGKSYQHPSTHVDDFLIIGKNLMKLMKLFIEKFDICHIEETLSTYL